MATNRLKGLKPKAPDIYNVFFETHGPETYTRAHLIRADGPETYTRAHLIRAAGPV